MGSRGFIAVSFWVGALAGVVISGCNDPQAAQATATRMQKVRQTAALYADREADSPRRLKSTIEVARKIERHHAERTVQKVKLIHHRALSLEF